MDWKEMRRTAEGKQGLKEAAESVEAQRLMARVNSAEVERAVKSGDAEALRGMLSRVLSTPEGKALAKRVQQAVRDDG